MKCLQAEKIQIKKTHRNIQKKLINPIGMVFTIQQEFRLTKKVNTQHPIISKIYISKARNVKTAHFGRFEQRKFPNRSQSSINLGPGSYDIANNSPGKYVQSVNRNNTGYSFSRSPRKGPQDRTYDSNFGPGMYDAFSQFGPIQ